MEQPTKKAKVEETNGANGVLTGQKDQLYLQELARPNILALEPYRCARDDYDEGILLDANENSIGACIPPPDHLALNRYPDPYMRKVKELIGGIRGVRPEQIFLGVGSDEAIDLLMRIFCRPGADRILTTPPTYGMYKVCAKVNDVAIVEVPLSPAFDARVPEILAGVTADTKLLFLCSPGNPTAKAIPIEVVREIFEGGYRGLVVVDEAYVDFVPKEVGSACQYLDEFPRLVVLQTLSKAFGLAGIRLGMAIGHPEVIRLMNNCKYPYNINKLTEEVALKALGDTSILEANVATLISERARVMAALEAMPAVHKVHPSDANFVLFQIDHAQAIYKDMAENGCVVRFRGNELHCTDCIRATVGTAEENDKMLEMLEATHAKFATAAAEK
ncbi:unnamed protein product [Heterosigma akashiwo]|uniref:histidinol-phosphate transaminase n=1 Tax=Heterosigma akashiwo TaxID=2829 RepID=A0A6V1XHV7_HETAK|mmetsp:Transcript_12886/g.17935  ORF Transcript_12886/g.17935 Transcript_12886/m.17935 type:complete len:389 (-) Transcript_12886:264-1430(-)|eukprot:CAMPEP_0194567078 /NCGR_PEP_ID=MMETSP0292-20121207/5688_1 /TAXON_ID=39354 /ORGANISM="Heterosigma akashiwo, Strain CCMP2393" /LENGTH=388 /DNA_ID=CAMNT_0039416757 /DNA_START=67 /DNA_END=1233 /DNA_ORIENTATION=+